MPHSTEGIAYLARLNALPIGPGVKLDDVLRSSLDDEQLLRRLFAQEKDNPRLTNPHVGLVDVFGPDTDALRKIRARVVDYELEDSISGQYVMPLKQHERKEEGEASMVSNLDEFKKNWAIFTEGSLSQLFDWNNVIAAGGSVLSALLLLSRENKKSKRAIRKYYHSAAFPSSDVDLFLWGLTPEQAEKKIVTIYEAVRDSVPWDVTCIRTKHTVSIHSQYPYRSVQIILRLYQSPAEVLAGFDIDAPCCAYDGERVWASPRALTAMIRQCNTVDVTRRSPSYEIRLAKYAKRGFEVYIPNLRRQDIDPTIYERSIAKIEGLARLLVLEKLRDVDARHAFLESRRDLRGRPFVLRHPGSRKKRKYKGDLKTEIGGLEMNDYDVASLHIPYGPGWNARRIDKLVYQTDLGMNSTFNPRNKGRRLHRHPAFFGTVEECMEDCCEHCPEPIDEDERNLQKEEDEKYIRGRISFIQDNPGRQTLSGSFNPIDEGEWSSQVYVKPIQKLFNAIAAHDITLVRSLLNDNKTTKIINLQNRDHVGRTTLHLAILVKNEEIAKLLVDEGCRMIARIVDGRTALHMAAQYGLDSLIEKMFEKSKENKAEAERKEKAVGEGVIDEDEEMKDGTTPPPDTTTDAERPSSADDWSSDENDGKPNDPMDVDDGADGDGSDVDKDGYDHREDGGGGEGSGKRKNEGEAEDSYPNVDDNEDDPDVLDVNLGDWDQGLTPLCYAVLYSTRSTVDILLRNGADPNQAAVPCSNPWDTTHNLLPLFLTLVRSQTDEDVTISIAERLIEGGATASTADDTLMTVPHYAVLLKKEKLLDTFLRKDQPGARKALDFPSVGYGSCKFPVTTALSKGAYASLLTLLAHGAKLTLTGDDVVRAKAVSNMTNSSLWGWYDVQDYSKQIYHPIEVALASGDHIVDVLFETGGNVNVGTFASYSRYSYNIRSKTILDWVVHALESELPKLIKNLKKEYDELDEKERKQSYTPPSEKPKSWKEHLDIFRTHYAMTVNKVNADLLRTQKRDKLKAIVQHEKARSFLEHVHTSLKSLGAKTWKELYPHSDSGETNMTQGLGNHGIAEQSNDQRKQKYLLLAQSYRRDWVPQEQSGSYDALFEAAFKGDDATIERLCVQNKEDQNADVLPIQIAVEAVIADGPDNRELRTGFTPFYAAIAGRRWNTAKLIMGIAAAQYHSDDDENEDKVQAALFDLVDEEDEPMSDNESTYSDDTVDARKRQTKFVNIAKHISVRTDVHPSQILTMAMYWVMNDKTNISSLILKIIKENNFEGFIHVFNIQESMNSKHCTSYETILGWILEIDNPKFLDEFIRRTGVGIDIDTIRKTPGEDNHIALNDQNRLYLGLNMHGRKRTDLARRGDPNAPYSDESNVPLVWKAIVRGAKTIIEYLASERPLAAYRHFAINGEGDKAEWLRHSKIFDKSLSDWLGWHVNETGESPLTLAVLENQKELLPVLFSKAAKLMGSVLHTKIKFLGFNVIHVAAHRVCDREIFEFLLKKGVSPLEVDSLDQWNIYHWLCFINKYQATEYLLEYLPREVSEGLLAGRTRKKFSTPLHMAVKNGSISLVEIILKFTQNDILAFDARGFTPLHYAIKYGYVAITEALLKVIPQDGLYLENGVGKTPYEDAEKRAMRPITDNGLEYSLPTLQSADIKMRSDVQVIEKELERVLETLKLLINNGTIEKGSKLANMFEKFVSASEGRLVKLKIQGAEEEATKGELEREKKAVDDMKEGKKDVMDPVRTFEAIAKAVGPNTAKRTLIHLKDVQVSVATDLGRVGLTRKISMNHDEFEDEEDEANFKGMVHRRLDNVNDL